MKKYNPIWLLLLLAGLAGCEDVVDVKLDEGQTLLAVDGWITDQPGPYTIRLTTTAPYFNNAPAPRVQGAVVTITDNEGNSEVLQEKDPGNYVTSTLQGKIGNTYTLNIRTGNEEYTAQTKINRVPPIDSLGVRFRPEGGFTEEGHYIYYFGPEPVGAGDSYRFKIYKNDTLLSKPENLIVAEDKLVDGNYIGNVQLNFEPFVAGDKVRVENWSITEETYLFYIELQQQIFNGGLFASPPTNVRTNVFNKNPNGPKAVGWFGGAGVSSREVIVKE
jgi:hypothetical protein